MTKHYIYEIKGVKIGCTKNIDKRIVLYNGEYTKDDLIIQDILTDETDEYAGEYERFLQKKLGYKVDDTLYEESVERMKIRSVKSHKICKRENKSIYNEEVRKKAHRNSVKTQIKEKKGFYSLKAHLKADETNKKNKSGIYNLETVKKSIETNKKNKTGFFAKIKCKHCDYIGNIGTIKHYHDDKCKYKEN